MWRREFIALFSARRPLGRLPYLIRADEMTE
jgi:hypothetical protein